MLLALRADEVIRSPYPIVFIPAWFVFGLMLIAPKLGWAPPVDRVAMFAGFWGLGLIWLLVFFILLCVHLDTNDDTLSLNSAFMPLWYVPMPIPMPYPCPGPMHIPIPAPRPIPRPHTMPMPLPMLGSITLFLSRVCGLQPYARPYV